jgi:3-hydroxyisobutyrate dehydrogenase
MDRIESGASIAFIGLGVMGQSMALNLLKAGYRLKVFTRTKAKAIELLASGAEWCDSIGECVTDVSAVITIVGYPADVRDIYLRQGGIIDSASTGTMLIDMTTSEPSLAVEISLAAKQQGLSSIDAPVSGGDIGARNATLSIMCGADSDVYEAALPLLSSIGVTIVLQGAAGSGQHTKMCNQIAIASNMIGVMEALLYARKSGLDPMVVLDSIGSGAAGSWSLTNLYPRVVKEDFDPGFYIIHFIKDMEIAVKEASSLGLNLPGLNMALGFYSELDKEGEGMLGSQALYKVLDRMNS